MKSNMQPKLFVCGDLALIYEKNVSIEKNGYTVPAYTPRFILSNHDTVY